MSVGILEDVVRKLFDLDPSAPHCKVKVSERHSRRLNSYGWSKSWASFKTSDPQRDPCDISNGLSSIPLSNICAFAKTENQMLKNRKSANSNEHQNRKTEFFFTQKNWKTDLKNSQNRKTENPDAPSFRRSLDEFWTLKEICLNQ